MCASMPDRLPYVRAHRGMAARSWVRETRGVEPASPGAIVDASQSVIDGQWDWPLHGLRHPPIGTSTGWYVWSGELSEKDDFFRPWHANHLIDQVPEVELLLALPPGSRFLIAPGYEDVWEDPALLDVSRSSRALSAWPRFHCPRQVRTFEQASIRFGA